MLVLSRKKNQTILINDNISIEVLQIKGNTIRLGIKAPGSVRILRGELKPFGIDADQATAAVTDSHASTDSTIPGGTVCLSDIVAQVAQAAQAS